MFFLLVESLWKSFILCKPYITRHYGTSHEMVRRVFCICIIILFLFVVFLVVYNSTFFYVLGIVFLGISPLAYCIGCSNIITGIRDTYISILSKKGMSFTMGHI